MLLLASGTPNGGVRSDINGWGTRATTKFRLQRNSLVRRFEPHPPFYRCAPTLPSQRPRVASAPVLATPCAPSSAATAGIAAALAYVAGASRPHLRTAGHADGRV